MKMSGNKEDSSFQIVPVNEVPSYRLSVGLYDKILDEFLSSDEKIARISHPDLEAKTIRTGLYNCILRRQLKSKVRACLRSHEVYIEKL